MLRIWSMFCTSVLSASLLIAISTTAGPAASAAGAAPAWQLPFENGQTWKANGPHRFAGNGAKPWESVDFGPTGANKRVVAVAAGKVYKVTCGGGWYLGVDHGNGWKSTYYHLTNYQSGLVGKQVAAGAYLGNAGRSTPCGGSAAADHVHLTILRDNGPAHLHGFKFGNYTVREGSGSYLGSWRHSSGSVCTVPSSGFMTCNLKSTTVAVKDFAAAPTPTISDTTPELGQTVTARPGAWNPTPSFSYQWRRGDTNISGATGANYRVAAADVGRQLSVVVTGTKAGYRTATRTSAKTSGVPPTSNGGTGIVNPASGRCVDVAGSGLEYGAIVHLWDCHGGANQAWRWNATDKTIRIYGTPERCLDVSRTNQKVKGQSISVSSCHGETNQQWIPREDGSIVTPHGLCVDAKDGGTQNRTVIRTWDCNGSAAQKFISSISGTVTLAPATARVGVRVRAAGAWTVGARLAYQWRRNGSAIAGATAPTYVPGRADHGQRLSVAVTGRLTGLPEVTKVSAASKVSTGAIRAVRPKLRGKARAGAALKVSAGSWRAGATKPRLRFQWFVGGRAVKGAKGASFRLRTKHIGKRVWVKVTASAPGYATTSRSSIRLTIRR